MTTVPRFFRPPEGSFFLFGPRGTGKTTWLRDSRADALHLNLLHPPLFRELLARPERLREIVEGALVNSIRVVILDEIQRLPDLLHVVHDIMESRAGRLLQFALTGSSARKLRRGRVDLLAGRAVVCTLRPFMAAEVPAFDLARSLNIGMVPLVVQSAEPEETLRSYVATYIEQEVKAEGLVRNLAGFGRFVEAVSFSHGAVLNLANVARDSQLSRTTVAGYIEVLQDLLLGFTVQMFTRRAKRKLSVQPKFYFFDAGVFRSVRPRGPLDRVEAIEGGALEGLVAQHLRAWVAYSGSDAQLQFWRTQSGVEVDFVLYGSDVFQGIQVQNSAEVRSTDLRALKTFAADYPEAEPLVLYRGERTLVVDGIMCMPVAAFLRELRPPRNGAPR
jgi:predicted AAA+ superfamily ATPase